jgi:hypothetical protein
MTEDQLMLDLKRAKRARTKQADDIGRNYDQRAYRKLMAVLSKILAATQPSPRDFFREAIPHLKRHDGQVELIYWVLADLGFPKSIAQDNAYGDWGM